MVLSILVKTWKGLKFDIVKIFYFSSSIMFSYSAMKKNVSHIFNLRLKLNLRRLTPSYCSSFSLWICSTCLSKVLSTIFGCIHASFFSICPNGHSWQMDLLTDFGLLLSNLADLYLCRLFLLEADILKWPWSTTL